MISPLGVVEAGAGWPSLEAAAAPDAQAFASLLAELPAGSPPASVSMPVPVPPAAESAPVAPGKPSLPSAEKDPAPQLVPKLPGRGAPLPAAEPSLSRPVAATITPPDEPVAVAPKLPQSRFALEDPGTEEPTEPAIATSEAPLAPAPLPSPVQQMPLASERPVITASVPSPAAGPLPNEPREASRPESQRLSASLQQQMPVAPESAGETMLPAAKPGQAHEPASEPQAQPATPLSAAAPITAESTTAAKPIDPAPAAFAAPPAVNPLGPTTTDEVSSPSPPSSSAQAPVPLDRAFSERVGLALVQRVSEKGQELVLRVEPAELGRVHVRLSFDEQGSLRATLAADSPAVVEVLQRESGTLERALTDAGVRTDAQSFRFDRGGTGHGGQQQPALRWPEPRNSQSMAEPEVPELFDRPFRTSSSLNLFA